MHSKEIDHPTATPLRWRPQTQRRVRQKAGEDSAYSHDVTMSEAVPASTATRLSLKSSHAHTFAQPRASQQSAFFDLTDELKASVLSYLGAPTVVGVCRATCQELCNFINDHENKIAHAMQKRELRRLQARSDKLKSFGPPTSVMEFVEGLRLFTKQRGIVTMQEHESRVAAKWVRHLFRNVFPYEENPTSRDDKWAVLATDFLQIQRAFNNDVRRGMPSETVTRNSH